MTLVPPTTLLRRMVEENPLPQDDLQLGAPSTAAGPLTPGSHLQDKSNVFLSWLRTQKQRTARVYNARTTRIPCAYSACAVRVQCADNARISTHTRRTQRT